MSENLPAYLRDDAPFQVCNMCGRKTWSTLEFAGLCGMTQPNGMTCHGSFKAAAPTDPYAKLEVTQADRNAANKYCNMLRQYNPNVFIGDSLAELLAAYRSHTQLDMLQEKEISVANRIRKAALDGCQCEPCIAARQVRDRLIEHTEICKLDLAIHGCICGFETQKPLEDIRAATKENER